MDKVTKVIIGVAIFIVGLQFLLSKDNDSESVNYTIQVIEDRPTFKVNELDYLSNDYVPIVKLKEEPSSSNPSGGICTGVVISNELVLTSAHCLVDENMKMNKDIIIESSGPGAATGLVSKQIGIVVGVNNRADYGLIKGNFTAFQKAKIDVDAQAMFNHNLNVMSCGFAWGESHYTCNPGQIKEMCGFNMCGDGMLIPGMSGGPTVSIVDAVVIGINRAAIPGNPGMIVAPLVGLFSSLGIKTE
jgi:hypothetical protein